MLECLVLLHVTVLAVGVTWAFGGQADFLLVPLAAWGSLSVVLAITHARHRELRLTAPPLLWLWPFVAFNAVVAIANLNPSFRELTSEAGTQLVLEGGRRWWPSSARPLLAWQALWLFDAVWLTCFNLVWIIRRRRTLRILLTVLVINTVVLSVFGTIQKLSHATGIYFNAVSTRQTYFFASFVYHNHWSAFCILILGAGAGLIWHQARHHQARDAFHSPVLTGLIGVLLIAATIPLSGSRSGTILLIVFGVSAALHATVRLLRQRGRKRLHALWTVVAISLAGILAAAAIANIARDTIRVRLAVTERQVAEMQATGGIGARATLYRNTWRMTADKPWFGWGMASFPHVFMLYNTQDSPLDRLPVFYHDAHSDWLQSLAEHGFVGTILLGLCALLPLFSSLGRELLDPIPAYLLAACALIALYAWVEFPFGNVAVVLYWWLFFLAAVQYAKLTRSTVVSSAIT